MFWQPSEQQLHWENDQFTKIKLYRDGEFKASHRCTTSLSQLGYMRPSESCAIQREVVLKGHTLSRLRTAGASPQLPQKSMGRAGVIWMEESDSGKNKMKLYLMKKKLGLGVGGIHLYYQL